MTSYEQNIIDRAYQSYVTGGDVFTLNFPQGRKASEKLLFEKAAESLEKDGYIEIIMKNEKRYRLKITDKGIDYGNRGMGRE